ncbi:MAG: hypothetical protein PGN34_23840 [Methylobacterium frigidaeris]
MSATASITPSAARPAKKRGFFAEMMQLWFEHNRRMLEAGVQPL